MIPVRSIRITTHEFLMNRLNLCTLCLNIFHVSVRCLWMGSWKVLLRCSPALLATSSAFSVSSASVLCWTGAPLQRMRISLWRSSSARDVAMETSGRDPCALSLTKHYGILKLMYMYESKYSITKSLNGTCSGKSCFWRSSWRNQICKVKIARVGCQATIQSETNTRKRWGCY